MKQLARILVDRRYIFAAVMLAVTIFCAFLAFGVEINTDMTRYLPANSPMRRGVEIIETAFPDPGEQSAFRFVFTGLDESEIPAIRQQIADHIYVSRVEYVPGNAHYNKDGRTLFIVSTYVDGFKVLMTIAKLYTQERPLAVFVLLAVLTLICGALFGLSESMTLAFLFITAGALCQIIRSYRDHIVYTMINQTENSNSATHH